MPEGVSYQPVAERHQKQEVEEKCMSDLELKRMHTFMSRSLCMTAGSLSAYFANLSMSEAIVVWTLTSG